jgi:hypothetical protein
MTSPPKGIDKTYDDLRKVAEAFQADGKSEGWIMAGADFATVDVPAAGKTPASTVVESRLAIWSNAATRNPGDVQSFEAVCRSGACSVVRVDYVRRRS